MLLHSTKVFITGATGFIGGRIAERLWLDHHVSARCLVRNYSKAARLARLPVDMRPGDILDRDSISQSVEGCDVIFHCAYGNSSDPLLNRRINEDGLRILGEIALKNGVRRFIHFSTVAVYGPDPPINVHEETPFSFSGDEYGDSKIRAEEICHDLFADGLPITIVRPTIVFGPFSPIWTIGITKRIMTGAWEELIAAEGLCNAVYVDDIVDGLFLCVENDNAVGETFILSGANPVTWKDYFEAYMRGLNLDIHAKTPKSKRLTRMIIWRPLRACLNMLRKHFEPRLVEIYLSMEHTNPLLVKSLDYLVRGGINKNEVMRFSGKTVFSINKAKTFLGYSPHSFEEGMKITVDWLRHHEYI